MTIFNKALAILAISTLAATSYNYIEQSKVGYLYEYTAASKSVCAHAASDGQFLVPVVINGKQLTLEVDTGAGDVVLNHNDALALGDLPQFSASKSFITGNGQITMNAIKANIQVGDKVYPNVNVYLNTNWTGRSVMGISLLSQFLMVTFNKTDICFIY